MQTEFFCQPNRTSRLSRMALPAVQAGQKQVSPPSFLSVFRYYVYQVQHIISPFTCQIL